MLFRSLYNLNFLITTLEKTSRAATKVSLKHTSQTLQTPPMSFYWIFFFFLEKVFIGYLDVKFENLMHFFLKYF